jgi:PPP family 3-phenylpropionic acid transporter
MIPATKSLTGEGAPPYFQLRSALSYCAPLIVNGIALPFFPVWLASLHFNDSEIGIILAVPMVVRVLAVPVVAMLADRMRERAFVLIWSGGLSLLTALALYLTKDFWPVLLVYTVQGATYASYVPVVESITISGVRRWGFDYGSMRVWGSIAFIFATLVGGQLIEVWGAAMVLPTMVAGFILTTLMGFASPKIGPTRRRGQPVNLQVPTKGALRSPHLLITMIGVSIQQSSHAVYYTFSSIYWHQIGISGTAVGVLWSVGVMSEVMVFFISRRLSQRFTAWQLISFGSVMSILRWILFPINFGFIGYFVLQCFHSCTYACVHTGIQRRILATVQETQEASAQGLYFFYNGMCLGIMTFVAGYLYAWLGLGSYYVMSGIAAFGLAMVIVAYYLQPQSAAVGGKTREAS